MRARLSNPAQPILIPTPSTGVGAGGKRALISLTVKPQQECHLSPDFAVRQINAFVEILPLELQLLGKLFGNIKVLELEGKEPAGGKTKGFSYPVINFLHHVAASPGQTDPPQKEDILESPLKLNSNIK